MLPKPPKSPSERDNTDESLHLEREKTDDELGKQHAALEEGSEGVVEQARGRADEVVELARERADATLEENGSTIWLRRTVRQERLREDAALDQERLTADANATDEREERMRALANLLRLEREQTDERLIVERARGDADLNTRDDFMGMVSHDLRTLLSGIALMAERQVRNPGADEAGQRNLQAAKRIQHLSARMNRLIGDLVDITSIEAGRFSMAPEERDAKALIRDTLEAFEPMASAKGVALTTTSAVGSMVARFDHERILQVLANLVSNAIKFSPEGGQISVDVESTPTEVRFTVVDGGAGIASEDLEAVFDRFWQAAQSDRRGLGLGLFISKCIVEAHGGRIWVESEPGIGSTFRFTLPGPATSPG